ncbi:hypothetical protein E4U10_003574 [Claviceps purpurea]|nr:hypothetical protein E4U10_003574 [Claviceps purpurea]
MSSPAGHDIDDGPPRIEIHKGGLNDFIRTAAATRGFKSDVDRDAYSDDLRQLPFFVNAKDVRPKPAGGGGSTDELVQATLVAPSANGAGASGSPGDRVSSRGK